jgi:hypothetical protein
MKAKIKGNDVLILDYGFKELLEENPHSSFDDRFSLEEWFNSTEAHTVDGYELVDVESTTPPNYNSNTHTLFQSTTPTVSDGKVIYAWTVVEKNAEELADAAAVFTIPAVNGFVPEASE